MIDGYFYRTKTQGVSFLMGELKNKYYSNNYIMSATAYTIMPLDQDYSFVKTKVIFGIVFIIICIISFTYVLKKLRQRHNTI